MNVASIKAAASENFESAKQSRFVKAMTSDTAKEVGKTAAVCTGVAVGGGVLYALFVKTAQVAHAAMS